MLPKGTIVAVADGETLNLFQSTGDETGVKLRALPDQVIDASKGTSGGHQSSSANPDNGQANEDGFAAGIVQYLNQRVLGGGMEGLVVVAAPRTLGEMRKHYHKQLSAVLLGEIAKDLTGHAVHDVEKSIAGA